MTPHFRLSVLASLAAACTLLGPEPGGAQGWIVDLSAGHSVHDPVHSAVGTTGVTLGLRHEGAPWFFVSGGAPFDSAGLPWGALGLGGRLATRGTRLSLGLDVGGHGFAFADRHLQQSGGGVAAEAMPVLALRTRGAGLEVRSGAVHTGTVYGGESSGRTIHQTDARAVLGADWLVLSGEGRYLRAAEADYPYVGAAAKATFARVSLSAHGGTWLTEAIPTPGWGVGARVRLHGATEAHLSFQQETSDPLYWNTPRRGWNAGFSHRIGRVPRGAAAPFAPLAKPGTTTFRLPLRDFADAPRVAGDFSGWTDVLMTRDGDAWSVTLPIAAGVYRYAFRRADGDWFVPEQLPGREPDGFGGFNAVLIVP
jgi:hypothetical protein